MIRIPRLALIAYVLAVAVIVSDQALKYWVLDVFRLPERSPSPLAGPFWLTLVWNKGVSFGVLNIDAEWTRWVLSRLLARRGRRRSRSGPGEVDRPFWRWRWG